MKEHENYPVVLGKDANTGDAVLWFESLNNNSIAYNLSDKKKNSLLKKVISQLLEPNRNAKLFIYSNSELLEELGLVDSSSVKIMKKQEDGSISSIDELLDLSKLNEKSYFPYLIIDGIEEITSNDCLLDISEVLSTPGNSELKSLITMDENRIQNKNAKIVKAFCTLEIHQFDDDDDSVFVEQIIYQYNPTIID